MRKHFLLLALGLLFSVAGARASMPKVWPVISETVNGMTIHLEFFSDDIIRVRKFREGGSMKQKSYSVIMQPEDVWVNDYYHGDTIWMGAGNVSVDFDKKTGLLTFYGRDGQVLLRETGTYVGDSLRQAWALDADEDIFGLGQLRDADMSLRGRSFTMWNVNTYTSIPYFTSEKGYGLYWDNAGRSRFVSQTGKQSAAGEAAEVTFSSETGDCIDYYFIYRNGTQDGLIDDIRRLTGQATMFPLWALGHWQCRERYKTSDELCEVVDKYRELRIPLDAIVQDWQYWGCDSNWNAMAFQNPYYINKVGDPAWEKYLPKDLRNLPVKEPRIKSPEEMVSYVHQRNAHLMISIWANFGPWTEPYAELKKIGALLPFDTWPKNSGVQDYDTYNPQARDIYWKYLSRLNDMGFDAWWTDSSEPDHFEKPGDDLVKTHDGEWRSVKLAFPLLHNKGIYEHHRASKGGNSRRAVQMTRSGAFGEQHYGTFSWSGDIQCSWEELKKQIPSGLNFSLCGIPFWNTDIGGFFYWDYWNNPKNPALQEIHTRWMQWGTFLPLMRNHCSSPMVSELYHFGNPGDWAYDAQVDAIRLRYRLLPYLYSMAGDVVQRSGTMMRALVMDFPRDKRAIRLNDEYMFGRALLVKPVTDSLFTWRQDKHNGFEKVADMRTAKAPVSVYLPAGTTPALLSKGIRAEGTPTRWYDFYTNQVYDGGQSLQRPTSIFEIPVYVRAGSIMPFGPEVQYATEKPWDDLEIRVYPGADGEFTLYEDEGDNYNYEKGQFSEITFYWDDAARELFITGRSGKFRGMLKERQFRIVIVDQNAGRGDQPMKVTQTVRYKGKKMSLRF